MSNFPIEALSSYSNSQSKFVENPTEEAAAHSENFVTCVYRAKVADLCRHVTITWSKNLMSNSLQIIIQNPFDDENPYTCKIDIKTWQFWGKKGLKSFRIDQEKRVDVFWDLRSAKFSTSPEPSSDYYVALVSNGEVVLLLGDQQKEAYKRTRSKPCLEDSPLVHKHENVFGKRCFSAKTMLGKGQREHYIVIETCLSGHCEPEMWIGIDGMSMIRLINLHWRFRGNEMILVDGVPVQIFWDVHDWLYLGADSGPGVFIFTQGAVEVDPESHLHGESLSGEEEDCMEFCHFLYAWMIE